MECLFPAPHAPTALWEVMRQKSLVTTYGLWLRDLTDEEFAIHAQYNGGRSATDSLWHSIPSFGQFRLCEEAMARLEGDC